MLQLVAKILPWRKHDEDDLIDLDMDRRDGEGAGPVPDVASVDPAAVFDAETAEVDDRLTELARAASRLGFEVVDVAAFLTSLRDRSTAQLEILSQTQQTSQQLITANSAVRAGIDAVSASAENAGEIVTVSSEAVRRATGKSRDLAQWVASVSDQVTSVMTSLGEVRQKTEMIEDIAFQVNILSLNAGIEASRAGEAGRGFAVIAQMINDLSDRTTQTNEDIRGGVQSLGKLVSELAVQSRAIQGDAELVIDESRKTDENLTAIATQIQEVQTTARRIQADADAVHRANERFMPAFAHVSDSVQETAKRLKGAMVRVDTLVDHTENIVQRAASLGGDVEDSIFIQQVMRDAARLSDALEEAVTTGRISLVGLFSQDYRPIAGSNPAQVMAPFTRLTDALFPEVQEAALALSDKVIFCAAVNRDGYLPTHNSMFSKPQRQDVAWNTANCRNRRIFDDRVGLKAGRNTAPFLLQVYRRDMGGGIFKLMKDVSAPIMVQGRHWGGLRLAYDV